jgi:response regulator RpfG family c-di-GMP phosphodiesterase
VLRSAVVVAKHMGNRRDGGTGAHLERMAHYSRLVAEQLAPHCGVDDEFLEYVCLFAPLHDIGKIAIPDEILLKPGKLSAEEFLRMKRHVTEGVGIASKIIDSFGLGKAPYAQILQNIVRYHHEWYDGSGYLDGLAGTAIPIEARIISVADVFDALTSERPYQPAHPNEQAYTFLSSRAGRQFDRDCVDALLCSRAAVDDIQRSFANPKSLPEAELAPC